MFDLRLYAEIEAIYEEERPLRVTHTVTQGVVDPLVSEETQYFEAVGGSGSMDVTVAQNVAWSIAVDADWIQMVSDVSQTGSRTIEFVVEPNPTVTERTVTLTLAGKTVSVMQAGLDATISYDGEMVFMVDGGLAYIDVHPEGNAQWSAMSTVPWITIVTGATDLGEGSVMLVAFRRMNDHLINVIETYEGK